MSCPGIQEQSFSESVSLIDYVQVIARRSKMIICVTLVSSIIAIICSIMMPKIYSATALVLPPQQQDQGLMSVMMGQMGSLAGLAGSVLGGGSTGDLYVGILKTEAVKDSIIDRFKLMNVYKQKYRMDTYNILDSIATIELGKKDGIVSITVEDKDPILAAAIANAYVDELARLTIAMNISGAGQNRSFLEDRLTKSKIDLARAEDALKSFQAKYKVLDVPAQAQASIAGVADLKAQLAAQEVQLASLRSFLTDENQEVKNVKASIATLNGQISRLEGNNNVSSSIPSVGSVPVIGEQYIRLMREFKIQESIVEMLTKQYEIAKINETKDISGIQVLQRASVPDKKIKPKRSLIVLGTTFISFIFAVFVAFVMERIEKMSEADRTKWRDLGKSLPGFNLTKLAQR